MLNNLLRNMKFIRISAGGSGTASGTPTKADILDMQGYKSVLFIAAMGDVEATAGVSLQVATASTDSTDDMTLVPGAAVAGTAGAADYDDKLVVLDVPEVNEQFIECQLFHETANAPFDGIIAVQYNPVDAPVTQDATVVLSGTVTA